MDVMRTIYDADFREFQVAVKIILSKAKFLTISKSNQLLFLLIPDASGSFKIGKKFNCVIVA